jgi:hypothetical protein
MAISLKIGVMECWSDGFLENRFTHYSITPRVLIPDILREPFQRQRMAEAFGRG